MAAKKQRAAKNRTIAQTRTKSKPPRMILTGSATSSEESSLVATPTLNRSRTISHLMARPARYWDGASLAFKLAEHIALLTADVEPFDVYERFGWIYDIIETLSNVQLTRDEAGKSEVSTDRIETLQDLLDQHKDRNSSSLRQNLLNLNSLAPSGNRTRDEFFTWHNAIFEIIAVSEEYAKDSGFGRLWTTVASQIHRSFTRTLEQLRSQGIDLQENGMIAHAERSITPFAGDLTPSIQLTELGAEADEATVQITWHRITEFFRRWSAGNALEAPRSFFVDIEIIHKTMRSLLGAGKDGEMSLNEKYIDSESDERLEIWSQRFFHLWSSSARQALNVLFQQMAKNLDGDTQEGMEGLFTALSDILQVMAPTPQVVARDVWERYCPRMADESQWMVAMVRLGHLYATYLKETFFKNEKSLPWLLVWRSVKSINCLLRTTDFKFPETEYNFEWGDRYSADKVFFSCYKTLLEFKTMLAGLEAMYPQEIENLVGRYCAHVATCRQVPDLHCQQLAIFKDGGVNEVIQSSAHAFHQNPTWDFNNHLYLQKMALRLTDLAGRPTTLIHQTSSTRNSDYIASIDSTSGDVDVEVLASNNRSVLTSTIANQNNVPETKDEPRLETATTEGVETTTAKDALDFGAQTLLSSLSFPYNPIPKTCANEDVQSRHVGREMASSAFLSEGPQLLDVQNTPPQQARQDEVSLSSASRSPLSVIRGTLYRLYAIRSRRRAVRPAIIGRQPQENRRFSDTDVFLGPTWDTSRRVANPSMRRSRHLSNGTGSPVPRRRGSFRSSSQCPLRSRRPQAPASGSGRSNSVPPSQTDSRAPKGASQGSTKSSSTLNALSSTHLGTNNGDNTQIYEDSASPTPAHANVTPTSAQQRIRADLFRDALEPLSSSQVPIPTIESLGSLPTDRICHRCPDFPDSFHHHCTGPGERCPRDPQPSQWSSPGSGINLPGDFDLDSRHRNRQSGGSNHSTSTPGTGASNLENMTPNTGALANRTALETVRTDPTGFPARARAANERMRLLTRQPDDSDPFTERDLNDTPRPPLRARSMRQIALNSFGDDEGFPANLQWAVDMLTKYTNGEWPPESPSIPETRTGLSTPRSASPIRGLASSTQPTAEGPSTSASMVAQTGIPETRLPAQAPASAQATQTTGPSIGTQTALAPAAAATGAWTPMNTQADYNRMNLVEMRAELDRRGVTRAGLGSTIANHVVALMRADATGNTGTGAYCERNNIIAFGGTDPGPKNSRGKK